MNTDPPIIGVVDDDPAILEVISLVLEEEGYQVVTDNGEGVVEMVSQSRPQLLLLDVWMQGGLDGRDICLHLKQHLPSSYQLPIVLMSAHSDASQSVIESRADGFLEKPFDMDELVATVVNWVKI